MSNLLAFMTALGPIFSISRIIGKDRVRRGEVRVLRALRESVLFIPVAFTISIFAAFVFAMTLAFALLTKPLALLQEAALNNTLKGDVDWPQLLFGVVLIVVFITINFRLLAWILQRIHGAAQIICETWTNITGADPPWPLYLFERSRPLRRRNLLLLLNVMPLIWAYYTFVLPALLITIVLSLAPLWVAEQVRARLTPDNPIFSDIVAYCMTTLAVVLRFL